MVRVKAIACQLPSESGEPLSRWSTAEIGAHIRARGLSATVSDTTIWRWLHEDAIRPWQHRCWIFPRDPEFEIKAGVILDLYQRLWKGHRLGPEEFVICADEKTSIQVRARRHPTVPARSGSPIKVEHEYKRLGAWAYLAAIDVHRAKVFGVCEQRSTIVAFDRLVAQTMHRRPYRNARRVFWIVDNGTTHRGPTSVRRLQAQHPKLVLVHAPKHASWLNQIEIYFSILQRKALTPSDFSSRQDLAHRILAFQHRYESVAKPFEWRFTRNDLSALLGRLARRAA